MTVASKMSKATKFDFDEILMDIQLQSKAKRGPKKMPYCLKKPKPTNQREDQPIVEATTSKTSLESNKRKPKEKEEPEKKRSKKV